MCSGPAFRPSTLALRKPKLLTWKKALSCKRELALEMGRVSINLGRLPSPHSCQSSRTKDGWIQQSSACPCAQEVTPGLWDKSTTGERAGAGAWRRPQPCSHWLHILASVSSPEKWAHAPHPGNCQEGVCSRHMESWLWAGATPLHSTTYLLISLPI